MNIEFFPRDTSSPLVLAFFAAFCWVFLWHSVGCFCGISLGVFVVFCWVFLWWCVTIRLRILKTEFLEPPIRHTCLSACLFGLDAKCGMRYCTQTFLGYEFARYTADAVGFVFNTHKGCLQCLDKLLLTCCHGS